VPSAGHPIERLTKRQREVLRLMAQGLANKEIATELGISTETARTHAAAILSGLGVENRTEATATYLRWSPRLDRAEVVLARPAIAVLPIPATGAKAAPLLAQAIARELTSLLSRWCHFPVIAHAATRDPRGLGDTTAEIGARLGARFLVDGALTCWRQRWRLTMHVVDASTSRLVWTEHPRPDAPPLVRDARSGVRAPGRLSLPAPDRRGPTRRSPATARATCQRGSSRTSGSPSTRAAIATPTSALTTRSRRRSRGIRRRAWPTSVAACPPTMRCSTSGHRRARRSIAWPRTPTAA
jgi:DNA-binding CsgD family transcriptional regulator